MPKLSNDALAARCEMLEDRSDEHHRLVARCHKIMNKVIPPKSIEMIAERIAELVALCDTNKTISTKIGVFHVYRHRFIVVKEGMVVACDKCGKKHRQYSHMSISGENTLVCFDAEKCSKRQQDARCERPKEYQAAANSCQRIADDDPYGPLGALAEYVELLLREKTDAKCDS